MRIKFLFIFSLCYLKYSKNLLFIELHFVFILLKKLLIILISIKYKSFIFIIIFLVLFLIEFLLSLYSDILFIKYGFKNLISRFAKINCQ